MSHTALSMAVRLKLACTYPDDVGFLKSHRDSRALRPDADYAGSKVGSVYKSTDDDNDDVAARAAPGVAAPPLALHGLLERVRQLEADFSQRESRIPERHLHLLRDLRVRVVEIDAALTQQLQEQQECWELERNSLRQRAAESAQLAEELRRQQEESAVLLRSRYEEALRQAEDALESSTALATQEIARLEGLLQQQQQQQQQEKKVRETQGGREGLGEVLHMQQIVDQSSDALEASRQHLRALETRHTREIEQLQSQFGRFRRAQAEIVRSLEGQLEDMHYSLHHSTSPSATASGQSSRVDPTASFSASLGLTCGANGGGDGGIGERTLSSLPEAEDKIRRLEFKFRVKSAELDAVLR